MLIVQTDSCLSHVAQKPPIALVTLPTCHEYVRSSSFRQSSAIGMTAHFSEIIAFVDD
jgi:hypothetical protein